MSTVTSVTAVPVSMTVQVIVNGLLAWITEITAIVTFDINAPSVE
jgi:hypothetical protein